MAAGGHVQLAVARQVGPDPVCGRGVGRQRRQRVQLRERPPDRLEQLRVGRDPLAEVREQLRLQLFAPFLQPEHLPFPLGEVVGEEPHGVFQCLDLSVVVRHLVGGRLPHLDVVAVRLVPVDGDVTQSVSARLPVGEPVEPLACLLVVGDYLVQFGVVSACDHPLTRSCRLRDQRRVERLVQLPGSRLVGRRQYVRHWPVRQRCVGDGGRQLRHQSECRPHGAECARVGAPVGRASRQPFEICHPREQFAEAVTRQRRVRERLDGVVSPPNLPAVPGRRRQPLPEEPRPRGRLRVVDRREECPLRAALHRLHQLQVPAGRRVECHAVTGVECAESCHRRRHADPGRLDVR